MAVQQWNARLELGVASIDSAHENLFAYLQQAQCLWDRFEAGEQVDIRGFRRIFNRLLDYTVMHFAEEEYLMELHRVPGREIHKSLHRQLERRLQELYRDFQRDGIAVIPEVVSFLENWWVHHILEVDQKDLEHLAPPDVYSSIA
jgi:hemerythrin-like metal-binding protein